MAEDAKRSYRNYASTKNGANMNPKNKSFKNSVN